MGGPFRNSRVIRLTRGQPQHGAAEIVVLGEVAIDCNTVDLVIADDCLNELITAMRNVGNLLTSSNVWSSIARTAGSLSEWPWLRRILRERIPHPQPRRTMRCSMRSSSHAVSRSWRPRDQARR